MYIAPVLDSLSFPLSVSSICSFPLKVFTSTFYKVPIHSCWRLLWTTNSSFLLQVHLVQIYYFTHQPILHFCIPVCPDTAQVPWCTSYILSYIFLCFSRSCIIHRLHSLEWIPLSPATSCYSRAVPTSSILPFSLSFYYKCSISQEKKV